jgi:hypothetical protein
MMKLPAVPRSGPGYLERNSAEALPAIALISFGTVASPIYRAEAFGGADPLRSKQQRIQPKADKPARTGLAKANDLVIPELIAVCLICHNVSPFLVIVFPVSLGMKKALPI